MTFGSLFSGIGGLDLGLTRAGMKCVWQVELDDYCQQILSRHFPETEKFRDVRLCNEQNLKYVDLIAGGFPCQNISTSGDRRGLAGEKSSLWFEFARILRVLRPKYALVENVSNLVNLGLDRILCDLAALRYDAEWTNIRASDFGLPHKRERLFLVAYPARVGLGQTTLFAERYQKNFQLAWGEISSQFNYVHLEAIGRAYPEIPAHLRMDDGVSANVDDIRNAIKGIGNSVAPIVGEWVGKQILNFEK